MLETERYLEAFSEFDTGQIVGNIKLFGTWRLFVIIVKRPVVYLRWDVMLEMSRYLETRLFSNDLAMSLNCLCERL